ncbi:wnt inhibitor of Dorsal protein [Phlebotomus papatasi]|uniref:wnt inhibitor of Dorsal protein n=1 Tax=Phlebotomus papatasi TaxID=29031 RepID=UPI002483E003|nr:wnt inhibitor of Dorsal protein [Phlebotomus papatasi]
MGRKSERLALKNCQEVFRWDQWNCPTEDFFLKKSSNSLDREGAFVKAITVAAVIYTSIKNCSANFMEYIAGNIRKMYDHGIKVSFDNTGRVKRNIKSESLVYLENSPNYCRENVTEGWPGMRGRQCSRRKKDASSLQERRSCRKLCRACGLKVKKKQGIKQNLCKCKFFWCCDVQCETCQEVINEYFCY